MSGRKMLRDLMSINDIYHFADQIADMLREDYGSYDADSLDEVLVEEPFAQRLGARGYDVKPWSAAIASAPPSNRGQAAGVVPVTVVRPRRPAGSGMRPSNDRPGPPDRGDRQMGRERTSNFDRNDRGQGDRPGPSDRGERPMGGDRSGPPMRGERPMGGERAPSMNRSGERPAINDRQVSPDRGFERPANSDRPMNFNRTTQPERPVSGDGSTNPNRAPQPERSANGDGTANLDRALDRTVGAERPVNVEPVVTSSPSPAPEVSAASAAPPIAETPIVSSPISVETPITAQPSGDNGNPSAQSTAPEQPAPTTRPASTRGNRKPIVNDSAAGPESVARTTRRRTTTATTEQTEEPAAPKQKRTRTPRSSSNNES